jgi:hypothetical protein
VRGYSYPSKGTIPFSSSNGLVGACIGSCPGETPEVPHDYLSSTISQPQEWFAQLVATDGTDTVYGGVEPFAPGGLSNPPGFDVAPPGTSHGDYNMTITCPNPCADLATGSPGTTSAPRSGSVDGQLQLGLADSPGGVHGYLAESGGFTRPPITYNVNGTIALGTITLKFSCGIASAVGSCDQPDEPSFTLTGKVDYGPCSLPKRGASECYQPSFAGPIAGGGSWTACFKQAQGACVDASTAKDWASKAGAGLAFIGLVPAAGEVYALAVAGAALTAIALDPPDPHYTRPVRPAGPPAIRLPRVQGFSRRAAAAATAVLSALGRGGADAITFVTALQRYEGAVNAAQPKWIAVQLKAALRYGHLAVVWYQRARSLLARYHRSLVRSPLGRLRVDIRSVKRSLRSIRKHGLPQALRRQLTASGIDAATIRAIGKQAPTGAPPGANTLWGPILQPSFRQQITRFTAALSAYLAALQSRPFA